MADHAAEIEVRSDSEVECEEIMKYDEVQDYLASGTYHEGVTKAVRGVSEKGQKKFQLVDGVLHYKEVLKMKTRQLRLRQVTYFIIPMYSMCTIFDINLL